LFFSLWDAWGLPSHHLPLGQPLCNTRVGRWRLWTWGFRRHCGKWSLAQWF
jgi:hypothetical protein